MSENVGICFTFLEIYGIIFYIAFEMSLLHIDRATMTEVHSLIF